jgi:autotransporter-associated beta strand protein
VRAYTRIDAYVVGVFFGLGTGRYEEAGTLVRGFSILGGVLAAALIGPVVAQAQITRSLGLDVSAWQTDITTTEWATLKRPTNQQVGGVFGDGRDFVFIRSSRGGTTGYYDQSNADNNPPTNTLSQRYDDPYFVQNITRATNAGLFAGSYHFSRPDIVATTLNANGIANTGADEADHFMQMAGAWMRPGYLLPTHDLEAGDGIRTDNEMAQFTLDFSNRVFQVMGIRPAIYINGNYATNILAQATSPSGAQIVATHPTLWSARWPNQADPNSIDVQNTNPKDSYSPIYGPWDDTGVTHPWSFWQYASTMKLNGNNNKTANTDVNVANGGIEFVKDKLVPALWMNDSSGDWSSLANWNSGQTPVGPVQGPGQVARVGAMTLPTPRLPGAAGSGVTSGQHDTVILDRASANVTVTLSSGTHNVRKLYAREALNITGGSLSINYTPSADSTPFSAQFSAPVSLSGSGALSVHTLQVDGSQIFTLDGGTLTFNKINLNRTLAAFTRITVSDDVNLAPLADAAAVIGVGSGGGNNPYIDLGGGVRKVNVANGAAATDMTFAVDVRNGGLIKSGAGTLALTGNNTYAMDTTVEAGTLRIGTATLANSADVYLTSGSLLDLNFSAGTPDVIDSLFIDGVSQLAGTWGGVGSGAQFTSPLISGTGLLQVSTYVAPIAGDFNGDGVVNQVDLSAWEQGFGMAGGAVASNGDGDADGDVDGSDFLVWQQNLGQGSAPGVAAIPEPETLLLAVAAGLALVVRKRR